MKIHSYESSGGKDLIMDYIMNLTEDEKVDGLSVLEDMENGKIECLMMKRWDGKVWEVYFRKHNRIFMLLLMGQIFIYYMPAESKRIKQKRKTKTLL